MTGERRLLRAWTIGLLPIAAIGFVLLIVQLRPGRSDDPPGPVLIVAGFGGSTGSLSILADGLRAAGHDVFVVPPVGDNTGSLIEQARALDRAAAGRRAAGARSVDVVAYSAGGVVARLWVAQLGGEPRRVITLGSPHNGTELAGFAAGLLSGACPIACRELSPDSELIRTLAQAPAGPRWTSIWTAADELVIPPASARLQGALNIELQQVCPGSRVRHAGLPTDPLTVALVERALEDPPLDAVPDPTSCDQLRTSRVLNTAQATPSSTAIHTP